MEDELKAVYFEISKHSVEISDGLRDLIRVITIDHDGLCALNSVKTKTREAALMIKSAVELMEKSK